MVSSTTLSSTSARSCITWHVCSDSERVVSSNLELDYHSLLHLNATTVKVSYQSNLRVTDFHFRNKGKSKSQLPKHLEESRI